MYDAVTAIFPQSDDPRYHYLKVQEANCFHRFQVR